MFTKIYKTQKDNFTKHELSELVTQVNNHLNHSKTKKEFKSLMSDSGYNVQFGDFSKNITFIHPDGRRIRNHYLLDFSEEDLSTDGIRRRLNMPDLATLRQNTLKKNEISEFCVTNKIHTKKHPYIYVLKLENDCYYIGYTNRFEKRMEQHFFDCKRVIWTNIHHPMKIIKVIDISKVEIPDYNKYESAETIRFMQEYGIEKVRGGDFVSEDTNEIRRLLKTHGFDTINNSLFPISDASDIYRNCMFELNQIIFEAR